MNLIDMFSSWVCRLTGHLFDIRYVNEKEYQRFCLRCGIVESSGTYKFIQKKEYKL